MNIQWVHKQCVLHVDIDREMFLFILYWLIKFSFEAMHRLSMWQESLQSSVSTSKFLIDIVQKHLKPLPLAVFSSHGHTVALTCELFFFQSVSPEEESSLESLQSQSQTADVTDKRRQREKASKEKEFSVLTSNEEWGHVKRKRESLRLDEWERKVQLRECGFLLFGSASGYKEGTV